MAPVENGACHGCDVGATAQMVNKLMNATTLVLGKTCGHILSLAAGMQGPRHRRR